jgi:hypothetical protein
MAININITPGSGDTVRADEIGGVKYQIVKLALGSTGVATDIVAGSNTMANSVPVVLPTNMAAGTYIGDVRATDLKVVITVTPTLTVHATYVSGDYVGTSASAMDFTTAARVDGGSGTIQSATLIDYAANTVACELWLFDNTVTPPADSAAWSISDADALKCIGVIPFSTYYASALNSVSQANNVGIAFKAQPADRSLFGCLVTRGAPTYASGDISIRLTIVQD